MRKMGTQISKMNSNVGIVEPEIGTETLKPSKLGGSSANMMDYDGYPATMNF
jgi:hypothetical protein